MCFKKKEKIENPILREFISYLNELSEKKRVIWVRTRETFISKQALDLYSGNSQEADLDFKNKQKLLFSAIDDYENLRSVIMDYYEKNSDVLKDCNVSNLLAYDASGHEQVVVEIEQIYNSMY